MIKPTILLYLFIAATAAIAKPAPNVLLICVDDLKPMLGCYGDKVIQTPHIDRLAARGTVFERAYCNQAVCAPSRNSLLTGLRPDSIGIYDLQTFFRKAVPDVITLPQRFKAHDYHAAAMGKILHTGHGNTDDAASWSTPIWRPRGGQYVSSEGKPTTEAADVPDNGYGDGKIADEAIRRLQAAKADAGTPFFLAVGFQKPHLPFCAPKRYWDLYQREDFQPHPLSSPPEGAPDFAATNWGELRQYDGIPQQGPLPPATQRELIHGYHATVSFMDAQVGRVLDELDKSGLAANTIVVFWGDHGFHLGDHGFWCKHTNYEQAARIPLIIAAPGMGHGRSLAPVETVDLYPTLCALAGIQPPDGIDGNSLVEILKDPSLPGKGHAFHVYPRGKQLGRAVRTPRHRLVEWKVPGAPAESAVIELYDLESDPGETLNLAATQLETVATLRMLIGQLPEAKPMHKTP